MSANRRGNGDGRGYYGNSDFLLNFSLTLKLLKNKVYQGTSLVAQWLRICLPRQVTWVRSLIGELRSHVPRGN